MIGTPHMDISCNENTISIHIPSSLVTAYSTSSWIDPNCRIHNNGTHLLSTIDLNSCGTTTTVTNTTVRFENEVILNQFISSGHSGNHQPEMVIPVECIYPRRQTVTTGFQPIVEQVLFYEKGLGHLQLRIQQVTDETFTQIVSASNISKGTRFHDTMYVKLSTGTLNSTNVGLHVHRCLATLTSSPTTLPEITLIQNG